MLPQRCRKTLQENISTTLWQHSVSVKKCYDIHNVHNDIQNRRQNVPTTYQKRGGM